MSFHCGWQSYSSIVGQKAIPRPVRITVNDCKRAFQLHRIIMEDGTTIEVKPRTISRRTTMDGNTKADGTCKGVTKIINGQTQSDIMEVKDYEVELIEYEGNFDIKTGLLLGNSKCKMSRDFCVTYETVLLYTAYTKACTLRFLKRTLFTIIQGQTFLPTKKEYLIMPSETDRKRSRSEETYEENTPTIMITTNQKEMIRLIRQTQQVKCEGVVYDTNYKGLYVSEKPLDNIPEKSASDVQLALYINAKMDFLYHDLQRQMKEMYQETIVNNCKLSQEIVQNGMLMAINNPELTSPYLLQEGVFAKVMGEGLYSYKFNKVAVTIASYNVCTSDLPVVYKNELRFVAPITRILLEKAAKPQGGSCGTILSPRYKIGYEWITLSDRKATRTPVHIIEEIAMQNLVEFKTLKNIHEGGIYSVEDIEQACNSFPTITGKGGN